MFQMHFQLNIIFSELKHRKQVKTINDIGVFHYFSNRNRKQKDWSFANPHDDRKHDAIFYIAFFDGGGNLSALGTANRNIG
jgi:hypothetical protein